MSTWPPWAVAWSELVNWMCSLDFRLVKAGMALYHHIGDIVSSPFSPKYAFFFTRLMIRVTKDLNQVLADSYALMALTHLAHWNVEGPGFFSLHTAFQTQYEELFTAIDEIAERVRALGDYATGGLESLARPSSSVIFS
jgi:hypothetical protein